MAAHCFARAFPARRNWLRFPWGSVRRDEKQDQPNPPKLGPIRRARQELVRESESITKYGDSGGRIGCDAASVGDSGEIPKRFLSRSEGYCRYPLAGGEKKVMSHPSGPGCTYRVCRGPGGDTRKSSNKADRQSRIYPLCADSMTRGCDSVTARNWRQSRWRRLGPFSCREAASAVRMRRVQNRRTDENLQRFGREGSG